MPSTRSKASLGEDGEDSDEETDDEPREAVTDEADRWFDRILPKWQKSQLYKELPKAAWKTRDDIPWVATKLYFEAHGELPQDWSWQSFEPVLVDGFPENVFAPRYYFKAVGRVMMSFCTFLQEHQDLPNLAGMPDRIKGISSRIFEHAGEVGAWYPHNARDKYIF